MESLELKSAKQIILVTTPEDNKTSEGMVEPAPPSFANDFSSFSSEPEKPTSVVPELFRAVKEHQQTALSLTDVDEQDGGVTEVKLGKDGATCCNGDEDDDDADLQGDLQGEVQGRTCLKDADRPSAARLAKRLYYLDGFRKCDVSPHLSKKSVELTNGLSCGYINEWNIFIIRSC